jgi:hypothetical protein
MQSAKCKLKNAKCKMKESKEILTFTLCNFYFAIREESDCAI